MASYLMGAYSGVDKFARVKSYKISGLKAGANDPAALFNAVGAAITDYKAEKATNVANYAIINLSSEALDMAAVVLKPGDSALKDPWEDVLKKLQSYNIILVYAAGNFATKKLENLTPLKHANSYPNLVVVGLVNSKNARVPSQTVEGTSDALSIYVFAHHCPCANSATADGYVLKTGTSGATAMVSGMISIMLAHGFDPSKAKSELQRISPSRKDGVTSSQHPNGVPIADHGPRSPLFDNQPYISTGLEADLYRHG